MSIDRDKLLGKGLDKTWSQDKWWLLAALCLSVALALWGEWLTVAFGLLWLLLVFSLKVYRSAFIAAVETIERTRSAGESD